MGGREGRHTVWAMHVGRARLAGREVWQFWQWAIVAVKQGKAGAMG